MPNSIRRFATFAGVLCWMLIGANAPVYAADAAFQKWLESVWPDAKALGVSRATFDAATRGLEPDLTLPDLVIPGRPDRQPAQAEFVQTPAQYLKESSFDKLAAQGRTLFEQHRATLAQIEKRFGVPGAIVLAIWARETGYGAAKMPYSAIRALATQAYLGRRKEQFREEFLLALKIVQEGHVALAAMRSSWAGAMGHPQILPSGFYKYAVDIDGDGKRDIWNSVPDALGTIANHLVEIGWQRGQRWAYEVRVPKNIDCTIAQPEVKQPLGTWLSQGYVPAYGRKLNAAELAQDASLLMPAGLLRPGVPDDGELLRAQGLQFLRSLRAVRRASGGSYRGRASVRAALGQCRSDADGRDGAHATGAHPARASTRTRSTARPAC